ncbi:MAG: amidophosphoribosyltransferase [Ruminococcaceae bacterium]|nr:amidophosphoribosyltransferase [Oscillospiraceae bacterium]
MGGFFGAVSKRDCVLDVFFGTDYHSHLGTVSGGMAAFNETDKFQRSIHNLQNTPFRTKFDSDLRELKGNACIGCISDTSPQPLLLHSRLGTYALIMVGAIKNASELLDELVKDEGLYLSAMGGGKTNVTELLGALINHGKDFVEGIKYAQSKIQGSASILILTERGTVIAARDSLGRTPIMIGKAEDGYCATFESFAATKLGYEEYCELGPGEIVEISADGVRQLSKPGNKKKICAFLWSYYGYPTSCYEGVSVERMRNKNGEIMARHDAKVALGAGVDHVCGVPDSGIAHAVGYSNASHIPYARPIIKYTPTWPRSFTPSDQKVRNQIAKMKLVPVHDLIREKKLLFVDDSIVRGTQMSETAEFLYEHGAKEVHIRSACPPVMYSCKYLNFSRSTSELELIARRVIRELEGEEGEKHISEYSSPDTERGKKLREVVCNKLGFDSVEFQSIDGLLEAIGLPACEVCTYCWDGKE